MAPLWGAGLFFAILAGAHPLRDGDLGAVRRMVNNPQFKLVGDPRSGQTALHALLRGRQMSIEWAGPAQLAGREHLLGRHELCINEMARRDPRGASEGCPIVDAIHYRNTLALGVLAKRAEPAGLAGCLAEADIDGNNVLHVVSHGMASGFGRHFVRTASLLRAETRARENKKAADGGTIVAVTKRPKPRLSRQNSIEELMRMKAVPPTHNLTLPALHRAIGIWDLDFLLGPAARRADPKSVLVDGGWLDARNGVGRTPYLVACRAGRRGAMRALVRRGSDASLRDYLGRSCKDYLRSGGFVKQNFDSAGVRGSNGIGRALTSPSKAAVAAIARGRGGGWFDPEAGLNSNAVLNVLHGLDMMAAAGLARAAPLMPAQSVEAPELRLRFAKDFFGVSPCVVRGSGAVGGWHARPRWTRANLTARYGATGVESGSFAHARSYGRDSRRTTIAEMVNGWSATRDSVPADECVNDSGDGGPSQAPPYVFEAAAMHAKGGIGSDVDGPALVADLLPTGTRPHRIVLPQFYLGPTLSGSQPHFHGDAVNALVYGAKLWLFFPPAWAFFSHDTAWDFFSALVARAPAPGDRVDAAEWWTSFIRGAGGPKGSTPDVQWAVQGEGMCDARWIMLFLYSRIPNPDLPDRAHAQMTLSTFRITGGTLC